MTMDGGRRTTAGLEAAFLLRRNRLRRQLQDPPSSVVHRPSSEETPMATTLPAPKIPVEFPAGLTRRLAEFVAELRYADLPAPVREAPPYYLLDYLGNAIGGSTAESSAAMYRFVRGLGPAGTA